MVPPMGTSCPDWGKHGHGNAACLFQVHTEAGRRLTSCSKLCSTVAVAASEEERKEWERAMYK